MGLKLRFRQIAKKVVNIAPRTATMVRFAGFELFHLRLPSLKQFDDRHIIRQLNENGYAVLPNYVDIDTTNRCIADIDRMMSSRKDIVVSYSDDRIFGAENLSENIMQFSSDSFLNALSEHYMAVKMVNCFTLAGRLVYRNGNKGSGEGWHKDSSFRQFKAILYLNDVTETNGAFQIIERSHKLAQYLGDMRKIGLKFGMLRLSDQEVDRIIEDQPERLKTLTGSAGTLLIVNTACIHRGCPPLQGVRYALTNYYLERYQIDGEDFYNKFPTASPEKLRQIKQHWNLRHEIARKSFT